MKANPHEWVHNAVAELIRRALLHRATGNGYVRIDFNEGQPRGKPRISLETIEETQVPERA